MTLDVNKLYAAASGAPKAWATMLSSDDTVAKEAYGAVRYTFDPIFGYRGFVYCRFDQSGGVTKDNICTYRGLVSLSATAGSTTSLTASATADILAGGIVTILDDAGAAGAAPEGETALVIKNTSAVVTIDSNDAFSQAVANGDTARVRLPFAVVDAAAGDVAAQVAGAIMATHATQYNWGWVQFLGYHPTVAAVAAGTTITALKSLIASTNVVTNSSTSTHDVKIGFAWGQLTTDTVLRKIPVELYTGLAYKVGATL